MFKESRKPVKTLIWICNLIQNSQLKGAFMKRYVLLLAIACISTAASAQKADAALVLGGAFTSDIQQTFRPTVGPDFPETFKFDHHIFLEGAISVRLLNAHLASLHVELPVAGIPSQPMPRVPGGVPGHLSALFITPGLRLKVLPISPISPWVSVGGGWARYSSDSNLTVNKGAVQFGGGLDFKTGLPLLGFRAEARDFVTSDPSALFAGPGTTGKTGLHHHSLLVGGGIVLRF
jgi:hypothetical protein